MIKLHKASFMLATLALIGLLLLTLPVPRALATGTTTHTVTELPSEAKATPTSILKAVR